MGQRIDAWERRQKKEEEGGGEEEIRKGRKGKNTFHECIQLAKGSGLFPLLGNKQVCNWVCDKS